MPPIMDGARPYLLLAALVCLAACGATPAPATGELETATSQATAAVASSSSSSTQSVESEPIAPATASPRPYRLQPGDLVLAAPEDAIPAILPDPNLYISAEAGDEEWQDEEPVIGVAINGQARAYPIRLLSNHEVVNDRVDGEPIAVTWCPLCYSAITFSRLVDGRVLTFGVSGYLFNSNLVMYDHQTNTLWSQLLGQSLRGAYRNQYLSLRPSRLLSWADWKELHPETTVLSAAQLGRRADDVIDPYVGYYSSGAAGLAETEVDPRLPAKELVLGVSISGEQIAYPMAELRRRGLIHARVGGQPLLLAYLPELESASVYSRSLPGRVLTFHQYDLGPGQAEDVQTQSRWDLRTGTAVAGSLTGSELEPVAAPLVFWFAWSGLRPQTQLYQP